MAQLPLQLISPSTHSRDSTNSAILWSQPSLSCCLPVLKKLQPAPLPGFKYSQVSWFTMSHELLEHEVCICQWLLAARGWVGGNLYLVYAYGQNTKWSKRDQWKIISYKSPSQKFFFSEATGVTSSQCLPECLCMCNHCQSPRYLLQQDLISYLRT